MIYLFFATDANLGTLSVEKVVEIWGKDSIGEFTFNIKQTMIVISFMLATFHACDWISSQFALGLIKYSALKQKR